MTSPMAAQLSALVIAAHDVARESADPAISRQWRALGDALSDLLKTLVALQRVKR